MMTYDNVAYGSMLYEQLLVLREDVLRRPIGMRMREKDTENDINEHHFVALDDGHPVGCVQLRPVSDGVMELRQMAVLEAYRGRAIGAGLAEYVEQFALARGCDVMETRARKVVEGFYRSQGYQLCRDEFEDKHTFLMRKSLR